MGNDSSPRFIYLIQGDGSQKPYDFPAGSDFLLLQWQRSFVPQPNSFHFPRSTWASGRNELYRRAKEQGEYDYFVFMDDDVVLGHAPAKGILHFLKIFLVRYLIDVAHGKISVFRYVIFPLWHILRHARSPWSLRDFEEAVERTNPLVAYPNAMLANRWYANASMRAVDGVQFGDQFFLCIHRSIIDRILPYTTAHDAENWWYSGFEFCNTSSVVCTPGKIHRYNYLIASNKASRSYPRQNITLSWNDILEPDVS
jgi:hypothetical protein